MDIFSGLNQVILAEPMMFTGNIKPWCGVLGLFIFTVLVISCEKPEGPGGKGTIRGQVMTKTYDQGFRVLQSVYPAADEDVYIKYGGGEMISDDRTTSPDGWFEFQYLSKGDYTVFVYSEDSTGTSGSGIVPIQREVNLSSNNQVYDLGKIYIYESLDVDQGNATIAGQILQVNYSIDFLYIIDTAYAQELDVYLVYEDDLYYSERVQTLYDGTFAFPDLIKGNYRVFVFADDIKGGSEQVPVMKNVSIDAIQGIFNAGIIYRPKED